MSEHNEQQWVWHPGLSTNPTAHKHLPHDHEIYGHESPRVWHDHESGDQDHVHMNPYKPEQPRKAEQDEGKERWEQFVRRGLEALESGDQGKAWRELKAEFGLATPDTAAPTKTYGVLFKDAAAEAGEWRYDCPCDFRHPSSRTALPGRYHEEGCYKRVSPEVEVYIVGLEALTARLREAEQERDRLVNGSTDAWVVMALRDKKAAEARVSELGQLLSETHGTEIETWVTLASQESAAEARVRELEKVIEELTPGGSEFVMPGGLDNALRFIRDRLDNVGKVAQERNDAEARVAELAEALWEIAQFSGPDSEYWRMKQIARAALEGGRR